MLTGMTIKASTLPDDSKTLKGMLLDFQDHYDKQTGILLEQISLLRAQLYGRKSEKHIPGDSPQSPTTPRGRGLGKTPRRGHCRKESP